AEDGIRGRNVTGVQTCALPISNDYEQVERTIDAASVIASIKPNYETPHFKLMFEEGYRAVNGTSEADDFDLLANTAMIVREGIEDRKSTRLNSSHVSISYAVFC